MMVGMEVNPGEAFDTTNQTVTQLITWLSMQNPDSKVVLHDGGTILFSRQRASRGGQIEVEVCHAEPETPTESRDERILKEAEVSKTDSPAEAERLLKQAQDKQVEENEDSILGKNEGRDQGGVVPGTSKSGSEKNEDTAGNKTSKGTTRKN